MSSSGYTPWSVTAGEIPTTAYWNLLGSNDASFNTGNGFNDGILSSRHYGTNSIKTPSLAFSNALDGINGVLTITNSGSAGGSVNYINLGGIKMAWGYTASNFISGSAPVGLGANVNLPSSFFSSIQSISITPAPPYSNSNVVYCNVGAFNTSIFNITWEMTQGANATVYAFWQVIGT